MSQYMWAYNLRIYVAKFLLLLLLFGYKEDTINLIKPTQIHYS